ncbi:MAG: low molecular weight phosphotyrosine protein phosphatase [Flavobacteriaceae bacterium]|nr:low molecular weight phosphotyrosine protein phosphatase [Flavobacteriaceae bacterium]
MTSILMVCLGNICRSPMAEGILKSKLPTKDFIVDSAGTASYHVGEKPDIRSVETALNHGVNITSQRSRQFKVEDFDLFDFIYVMDYSNYDNVVHLARNEDDKAKVKLILEELKSSLTLEVPDPYYGGEKGFKNVYIMLDKACNVIAKRLLK